MSKSRKKPKILDDGLIEQLKKLPDLLYAEDFDRVSPAHLLAIMEALDDSADFINDYLTDINYSQSICYPDIDKDIIQ